MSHPLMFDEHDPLLTRLRELVASFPGTAEKISHGHPAFYTKKIFAYFGGSVRDGDTWVQHEHSVLVLPDPADREALVQDPRTYVPAYLGPYGWLGLDLDQDTDWAEVHELLDASYRLTAPKRLVSELDALATTDDPDGA